jgi:hypothetical protein
LIDEDTGDRSDQRLRHRQQQMQRIRSHARRVLLGDHPTVVQHQEPVGVRSLDHCPNRGVARVDARNDHVSYGFLGNRKFGNHTGAPRDASRRHDFPRMLKTPLKELRCLPICQRRAGIRGRRT